LVKREGGGKNLEREWKIKRGVLKSINQQRPYLYPYCIPIDPFYLTWKAREYDFSTRFIELAGEINTNMPYYVVQRVGWVLNRNVRS